MRLFRELWMPQDEEYLRQHPWINNCDNPIDGIAENLVAISLKGELAPANNNGWDVLAPGLGRVKVKAKRLPDEFTGDATFDVIPEPFKFDAAAFLVFNMDYRIRAFVIIHRDEIKHFPSFNSRVGGWAANVQQILARGSEPELYSMRGHWQGHGIRADGRDPLDYVRLFALILIVYMIFPRELIETPIAQTIWHWLKVSFQSALGVWAIRYGHKIIGARVSPPRGTRVIINPRVYRGAKAARMGWSIFLGGLLMLVLTGSYVWLWWR